MEQRDSRDGRGRPRIVAVIGGGAEKDFRVLEAARRLGGLLAREGWVVVTGGGGGVMEAASAGAREACGRVVGVLPGARADDANPHVEIPIATGLGEARNAVIATAADALVAVGGEHGTLSEIALGLKLSRPVIVLLSSWSSVPGTVAARDPGEAVEKLRALLGPTSAGRK